MALLGTLVCVYREPRRFTAAEREAASGLAGLATLALANAWLQHEARQRLEETRHLAAEQAALLRVATRVAATPAADGVFAQAARECAALLGVQCGLVARFEQDHAVPVGWWGAGPAPWDVTFPHDGKGALALVARTGRVARVDDYAQLDDPVGRMVRAGGYRSSVAAPIRVAGSLWGALLAATTDGVSMAPGAEERLKRFAELVALAIANTEAQAQLAAQAMSDPLTGLANHRAFFERLHAATQQAHRHGHPACLVVIDVDHFKRINDTHGHLVGDGVLVEIGSRLSSLARAEDTVARIGGEEFAWLLPECDARSAWIATERARQAIACRAFPEVGSVTISAGVAELQPGMDVTELFRAADAGLYWAKSQGRNRSAEYAGTA